MNEIESEFPPLFLRRDFAGELGWDHAIQRPLSEAAFAELCRKARACFSWFAFRQHNGERSKRRISRYYFYGGLIKPGALTAVPFIADGRYWYYPPLEGLFTDMLVRVRIAGCGGSGQMPLIFPEPRAAATKHTDLPARVLWHDTALSIAFLTDFRTAIDEARLANYGETHD